MPTFRLSRLLTPLCLSLAALSGATAHAGSYPDKPITVIVPFAAGGPTDTSARTLATALSEAMGTPFVVENLPGAGGSIATARAAAAAPDGYTLLWGTGSALSILPNLREVSYDAKTSFSPVSLVVSAPFIMAVRPTLNVKSIDEFVTTARARPNELNYSSSGTGGTAHMIGELFNMRAEVDAVHIPYNGGAPMMQAVLAGDVDYAFDTHVQKALADGKTRESLEQTGFFVEGTTPEGFARKIDQDNEQWAKLIQHAEISITN